MKPQFKYLRWFSELGAEDAPLVGGKIAKMSENRKLSKKGILTPNGYSTTIDTFNLFMEENGLWLPVRKVMQDFVVGKKSLSEAGLEARNFLENGIMPSVVQDETAEAYHILTGGKTIATMERSSAPGLEDTKKDAFAGIHDSFDKIYTVEESLRCKQKCYVSLFNDRAIAYRMKNGYSLFDVCMVAGTQIMVRSDHEGGTSGVIFTVHTESGFPDVVLVTATYGFGGGVGGDDTLDEFYVFKPTIDTHPRVLRKVLGSKRQKIMCVEENQPLRVLDTTEEERGCFCISDDEAVHLARQAMIVERHHVMIEDRKLNVDIEYAADESREHNFVQTRPETAHSETNRMIREVFTLKPEGEKPKVIVTGAAVGRRISSGKARVLKSFEEGVDLMPGEIFIAERTSPDWEYAMEKSSGMITDNGGRTCHAAITARKLKIPAIVGCGNATTAIKTGDEITVSCAEGEIGHGNKGLVPFEIKRVDLSNLPLPKRTKIMVNLDDPTKAFDIASTYGDVVSGVGLTRTEMMDKLFAKKLSDDHPGIHPLAYFEQDSLEDPELRAEIDFLARGYESWRDFYVSQMAQGIATIAAAFYPKPVIIRLPDARTDEYLNMRGAKKYEPRELNPMMGRHGAYKYFLPGFHEHVIAVMEALRRARYDMGLSNIQIMVPFVRTLKSAREVIELLAENGLKQSEDLKLICMYEIPANAFLVEKFLDLFWGGLSEGSNDGTQGTLMWDRDITAIGEDLDERNEAVLVFTEIGVTAATRRGMYFGVCGDAPSTWEEFTEFLVRLGASSISLEPDSVFDMLPVVARIEKELGI